MALPDLSKLFVPAGWIIVALSLYFAFVPPAPQWFLFSIAAFGVLMAVTK